VFALEGVQLIGEGLMSLGAEILERKEVGQLKGICGIRGIKALLIHPMPV